MRWWMVAGRCSLRAQRQDRTRWRQRTLLLLAGPMLLLQAAHGWAESLDEVTRQILQAQEWALAAERAARSAEKAAQRSGDAIRAERRAVWLSRTAEALRRRGGREFLAARRGAELAQREREAIAREARNWVRQAVAELDALLVQPETLRSALTDDRGKPLPASQELVAAAAQLHAAAAPVREALYEVQAVQVRTELLRSQLTGEQAQRMEESLTRRRAGLLEALENLTSASERLARSASELTRWRDSVQPAARERTRRAVGPGFGAGVGIGFQVDVGGKERVESASIGPNAAGQPVVRVDHDTNSTPHLVLEAHYVFPISSAARKEELGAARSPRSCRWCTPRLAERLRWGPFVAVQPGDDFIDAVGAGWMVAGSVEELHERGSINIGVGYFADPNTRVLADGFRAGAPPPAGETQVRFKRVTQSGVLILLTYGF